MKVWGRRKTPKKGVVWGLMKPNKVNCFVRDKKGQKKKEGGVGRRQEMLAMVSGGLGWAGQELRGLST